MNNRVSMGVDNDDHEEVPSWGTSLPVESVQEIVRKDPSNVPEKYIHHFDYTQTDVVLTHLSSDIPVIDLSLLSSGDEVELQKLDMACRDWGFFQVLTKMKCVHIYTVMLFV